MVAGLVHSQKVENLRKLTIYEYTRAGIISSFLTRVLIQPFDVVKIRFQLQEEPLHRNGFGKYNGIFQSIKLIVNEEGFCAFWKGHVPAQGLSCIYGLIQFTTFEMLSHQLKESISIFNNYGKTTDFFCGAVAGSTAMTFAMPLDVIRTRLVAQGEPKVYHSTIDAIFKIWKTEKIRGFYYGLVPSLLQIMPYAGIQFTCYNFFFEYWKYNFTSHESMGALICGAISGIFAKTVVYPLDLVKHRLQVNKTIRKGFGRTTATKGMILTLISVVKFESAFGLFKGLSPSILKASASSGFSFLFYELFCNLL